MPMSLPPAGFALELSQNTVGLSEADYTKYVSEASQTMGAIMTAAHQIVLVKAVDAAAAAQVKKLISGPGGYDAKKWICVFPQTAIVIDSGVYVLLVASSREVADTAANVFKELAGSTGDVVTFFDFAG